MLTPPGIPVWFDHWFAKKAALLDELDVPNVDPLDGIVGNEANGLQGLADMKAGAVNHPPTGNEPNPADYQAKYDQILACFEFIRRFVGGGANGGQGY